MRQIINRLILMVSCLSVLSGCARDLSSNVYTSDSTLSLTLEGQIVAVRPVIIKNNDQLSENTGGILTGALAGGTLASGGGSNQAIIGGVLAGALVGSVIESNLGKANGFEYIVKIDTNHLKSDFYHGSAAMRDAISAATTNGLVTIIQGKDVIFGENQKVYVIFSPKRTRIIARK